MSWLAKPIYIFGAPAIGSIRRSRFRRFAGSLACLSKWLILGAFIAWLVSAVQAALAPSPERFFRCAQWPDGRTETRGEFYATDHADFIPRSNDDGSTTYVAGVRPPFVSLLFPIRGQVTHTRRGDTTHFQDLDRTPRVETQYFADVYGWPFGAVAILYSQQVALFSAPLPTNTPYALELGIPLGGVRPSLLGLVIPRALPLLPWPGMAINASLYGLCFWLCVIAARRTRQIVRVRRGFCGICGYPIPRGSDGSAQPCPECGKPLTINRPKAHRRVLPW